ncbi:MAG: rRNA maturation RNase YbeY [Candidatus Omnitrophica bacterium]|nr:rRNA maturation RNase YbeY [Candidatus Omnitrophota bacterium]
MPLRIRVKNLNKRRRINYKSIEKVALHVIRSFKKADALVDITFLSNGRIKTLNGKYMHRNKPTDVISFSLEEKSPLAKKRLVGDIYISSDMADSNARRFNTSFHKELALYVVHGVLHVLGFGDKTKKEKIRIRKLEEKFLTKASNL